MNRRITKVLFNGSKWCGEEPDPLAVLEERLATEPLNPRFEHFGDFVLPDDGVLGGTQFFGNFLNLSAAFSVVTNDAAVVARLTVAVRANQALDDYREARPSVLGACSCETCRPDPADAWRRIDR